MKIFISHPGYTVSTSKKAVLKAPESFTGRSFSLINRENGDIVYTGEIVRAGTVDNWKDWYFFSLDFSGFKELGRYYIDVDGISSEPFYIEETIYDKFLHNEIINYFKSQRSSGKWDRKDRTASFVGKRTGTVDVSGGWYDASGDISKYLTHLSYANFFNPQQIPGSVWHILKLIENSDKRDHQTALIKPRVIDEALFGADFLVRMFDKDGYFYSIVFDKWSKAPEQREICAYETQKGHKFDNYQAGYRQGAGVSIAALAKASTLEEQGEFSSKTYLDIAIKAFDHLEINNTKYLDDGEENIIDDYCALLAATELFKVTGDKKHKNAADKRAKSLMDRQTSDNNINNWFRADNVDRPYFHAAEAGFPIISLIEYLSIEDSSEVKSVIKNALNYELEITSEVTNPFGYARQYTVDTDDVRKTAFFIPHKNETGYWWQGENARIASLAAAAYMGSLLFSDDKEFSDKLLTFGNNQMHWILGLNPYDMCMLYGRGRNTPDYAAAYPSFPGGICNGITGGFLDESDIDFQPECANTGDNTWRWGEQWIPHASWFLFASSIIK
ncbi:MAG: glycoside hydrolase family 9 protein [Spirochaetaceae bacterium]